MAKTQTVLTTLVASPNDVKDERNALERVIQELNNTWANTLNIRLELVRWETFGYPGVSVDAQAVLNEELPEYDIFIGILWTRFGTPTKRAGSGTGEEFDRAYTKLNADPSKTRIMFYFKDKPVPPHDLDLAQYGAVDEFRRRLPEKGVLSWTFSEIDDFAELARIHLSRQVQEWGKSWGMVASEPATPPSPTSQIQPQLQVTPYSEDEDVGFLDLIEIGTGEFERSTEIANRITDALNELTKRVQERTARLAETTSRGGNPVALMKKVINQTADDLEQFVAQMKTETPMYGDSISKALESTSKAATLLPSFHPADYGDLEKLIKIIDQMHLSLNTARNNNQQLRQIIAASPPATTHYNRARRHTITALDDFLAQLQRTEKVVTEVQINLRHIIDDSKQA